MSRNAGLVADITRCGVVAILRLEDPEVTPSILESLLAGGVDVAEITMTTPGALETIQEAAGMFEGKMIIGVGSVLDETTARLAILAGARFVVTPVFRVDVVRACRRYGVPVICGAYTPTEALTAQEAGADFVKIFPADKLGADYIRAIKAPMPHLQLIPTGGVNASTAADFIRAGCSAVAAGSSLVSASALAAGDWEAVTESARALVAAVADGRAS